MHCRSCFFDPTTTRQARFAAIVVVLAAVPKFSGSFASSSPPGGVVTVDMSGTSSWDQHSQLRCKGAKALVLFFFLLFVVVVHTNVGFAGLTHTVKSTGRSHHQSHTHSLEGTNERHFTLTRGTMPLIRLPRPDGTVRVAVLSLDAWQALLGFTNVHLDQVVRQAKHLSQAAPDFNDPTVRSSEASNTESALHIAAWHVRESMQRAWGHTIAPLRAASTDGETSPLADEDGEQQQHEYGASSSGHAATPLDAQWAWVDGVPAKALHQLAAGSSSASSGKQQHTTTAGVVSSPDPGAAASGLDPQGGGGSGGGSGVDVSAAEAGNNNLGDEDEDRPLAFGNDMPVIVSGAEVHSEQQQDVLNEQQAVLKAFHEALSDAEESGDQDRFNVLVRWLTEEPMSIQLVGLLADLFQKQLELNLLPTEAVAKLIEALLIKIGRTSSATSDPPACVEPALQQLVAIVRSRLLGATAGALSVADGDDDAEGSTSNRLLRQWARTLLCIFHLYPAASAATELHLVRGEIVRQMIHRLSPILQQQHSSAADNNSSGSGMVETAQHVQLLQVLFEARHLSWFSTVNIPASLQTLFQQTERELLSATSTHSGSGSSTAMSDEGMNDCRAK
jgi:hypothetical protein